MLLFSLFAACAVDDADVGFVSPFDGQTNWPPEAPLQIHLPGPALPEGYPTPQDLVRVVDLDQSGQVPGTLVHDGHDLFFHPDTPFEPGTDYAWQVDVATADAREPDLTIPESLSGVATFSTAPRLDALEAVVEGAVLCLVLSRDPREGDGLIVQIDGVPVTMGAPVEVSIDPIAPDVAEPPVQLCTSEAGAPGSRVRVGLGDRVWQFEATERSPAEAAALRFRVSP